MAYTAEYSTTDLDDIFVDLFGNITVVITENVDIIVVLLILSMVAVLIAGGIRKVFGIFGALRGGSKM